MRDLCLSSVLVCLSVFAPLLISRSERSHGKVPNQSPREQSSESHQILGFLSPEKSLRQAQQVLMSVTQLP